MNGTWFSILRLGWCGAVAAVVGCQAPTQPSIVLVALDTLRADRLGSYGNADGLTPNLDELARDSLVFDHAYAQSTETLYSFGSLLTGRAVSELGPATHEWRVPDSVPMLAEVLAAYGYDTGGFVGGAHLSEKYGLQRGFETYRVAPTEFATLGQSRGPALDWLAERERPYFALVHGYDTHARYWKPPPLGTDLPPEGTGRDLVLHHHGSDLVVEGAVTADACLPVLAHGDAMFRLEELDESDPTIAACLAARRPLLPEEMAALREAYDGAVRWADAELGLLLAGLEEQGILEEATVIVFADHGEALGEAGHFGHRDTIADTVVQVPLIVRPPGGTTGRHVRGLTELKDVHATILDLAGAASPAHAQGTSFRRVLEGADDHGRRIAVTESWSQTTRITNADGEFLAFEGLGWDHPRFGEVLAWSPVQGPAFRASTIESDGDRNALRAALGAWVAARHLEIPIVPDEPDAEEALRRGGYWTP